MVIIFLWIVVGFRLTEICRQESAASIIPFKVKRGFPETSIHTKTKAACCSNLTSVTTTLTAWLHVYQDIVLTNISLP